MKVCESLNVLFCIMTDVDFNIKK